MRYMQTDGHYSSARSDRQGRHYDLRLSVCPFFTTLVNAIV